MAIDPESFYGKRKNCKSTFEENIEKYKLLRKIKTHDEGCDRKKYKEKIFL